VSDADQLTPAYPHDLADAVAFALRFDGRKRVHNADGYMAAIAAKRVVRHLEQAGFVVRKKPPLGGRSAVGRGFAEKARRQASAWSSMLADGGAYLHRSFLRQYGTYCQSARFARVAVTKSSPWHGGVGASA
jgi:hypothetical protein